MDEVAEMRGHHRTNVHDRIAQRLRMILEYGLDPDGGQPKSRILGGRSLQCPRNLPGVDGQKLSGQCFPTPDFSTFQRDPIGVGAQFQIIANMNGRGQKPYFLGKLAPQPLDPP